MKKTFFSILLISFSFSLLAKDPNAVPSLTIKVANDDIVLDGILNESSWDNADIAKNFHQNFPSDTTFANSKTEVKLTYDTKNIYIAAICYDEIKGNYIFQSLKRDFDYSSNDAFAVYLDPFNDKTNGFCFAVNPMGVQLEGLLEGGASRGIKPTWDNTWHAKVKRYENRWVVEMAIPFNTIRYNEGNSNWRINFSRNDLKRNERSTWTRVPRNVNVAALAFTGNLMWDKSPIKPGRNTVIIPYTTVNFSQNYEDNESGVLKPNIGLDAKIAITSSLNLDLTVNSDFAQAEVDQQVTNLSRFSLFFPERRNFFIENNDLFANFGFRQIRPFFSRRIGLYDGEILPIIGGARLSGKLNKDWRIGIMNMQTEGVGSIGVGGQNYSVAAFQRQVFARSSIAGIFVNRQGFKGNNLAFSDYNRVAGIDFNLMSSDNKVLGKAFFHKSFSSGINKNSYAHASWLAYLTPSLRLMWNHEYVGKGYNVETGFVPRVDNYNPITEEIIKKTYWRIEPLANFSFYPASKIINSHGPGFYISQYLDSSFNNTERTLRASYQVNFSNTGKIEGKFENESIKLFYDTDVTFADNTPIPMGTYNTSKISFQYNSDKRKAFTYKVNFTKGGYFNGKRLSYGGTTGLRVQPWGLFSLSFRQDFIKLPAPYQDALLTLVGPRIDLSFTKKHFFTTFIQYNTQSENININSRFQWRFKPMSDLFLVYTDNYLSAPIMIRNRALILKFVYWLNT